MPQKRNACILFLPFYLFEEHPYFRHRWFKHMPIATARFTISFLPSFDNSITDHDEKTRTEKHFWLKLMCVFISTYIRHQPQKSKLLTLMTAIVARMDIRWQRSWGCASSVVGCVTGNPLSDNCGHRENTNIYIIDLLVWIDILLQSNIIQIKYYINQMYITYIISNISLMGLRSASWWEETAAGCCKT